MAHSEAHSQSGEELSETEIDYKSICTKIVDCFTLRECLSNLFSLKHAYVNIFISEKETSLIMISGPNLSRKWLAGKTTENTQILTKMKKINSHPLQKPKITKQRSQMVCPLSGSSVVSSTCNHNEEINSPKDGIKATSDFPEMLPLRNLEINSDISGSYDYSGGALTSKDGDLKLTIPKGAIRKGDSVTFSIATSLFGPFVLPSQRQVDLVSPYYWIGVTESYCFHKPVQVEFEHFAVVTACDSSHYQLLTCKDDDMSHIMRPVDCELRFDNESRCTFYTDHFCSYCLYHKCEDPITNRIGAFFLKPKNFQILDQFTVEIWFSFSIGHCLKRNEELYTRKGMVLDTNGSNTFEASCDKDSTSYFALNYDKYVKGWCVDHFRSTEVQTKTINFYNLYTNVEDLLAHEENELFPPRFVINVIKQTGCTADLNLNINVSLCKAQGKKSIDSTTFKLFVPVSANTSSHVLKDHYCCIPKLGELLKFSSKVSMYWDIIAVTLGIPLDEIDRIKRDYHTNAEKICGMFSVWLQTQRSPCWCHFISALYEVELNEIAEQASLHLEESGGAVASSDKTDMTKDDLKYSEHVVNSHELVRILKDIPDRDLNLFITSILPRGSAMQVMKQIRDSNGSKRENVNTICQAFLKESDPSWSKVHKALKEVDCDDLAELVEACFLPL